MPKLRENQVPSYRLHKQSGQAIVTFSGKDHLLGRHGSAASKEEYKRLTAEWLTGGAAVNATADLTVVELIRDFLAHAKVYYRRADGTATSEVANFIDALLPLKDLYGRTNARDFGPLALKAVRDEMIRRGWCRTNINRQVNRIKHVFKWGVGAEILPSHVYEGLRAVPALAEGRTTARESAVVEPAPDDVVEGVLPHLSRQLRAMVELQVLTGMRPGEVCGLRGRELDRTSKPWKYTPKQHKTAHRGHPRVIPIGPRGQELLMPFLKLNPDAYLFSPAEAEEERRAALAEARKTCRSCGNVPGSNRRHRPRVAPGHRYEVAAYDRAIARACERTFPPPSHLARKLVPGRGRKHKMTRWETPQEWFQRLGAEKWDEQNYWRRAHHFHPHQLRHSAATRWCPEHGPEITLMLLGDKSNKMIDVYVKKNLKAAEAVVMKIG